VSSGSTPRARYAVGIDLGTTNSAVAAAEPARGSGLWPVPIPQVVAEGEVRERDAIASAIYLAGEHDVPAGALGLPWRGDERFVVGAFARRLGARVAGRLVTSAKSWLCHGGVDRTAAILPWGGAEDVPRLSPVAASARILEHLRDAWDTAHPEDPLAMQDVVITVPASFDEVARELTVRAAADAGLGALRLLEEPQAAIYAWIAANEDWRARLEGVRHVLVVDVGGGTTDFSLVAVRRDAGGLALERVAVGDHLLLGGDNMDIALARRVAERRSAAASLDAARWLQLVDQCREAKERLLGDDPPAQVAISLAGRGRGVVSGAIADAVAVDEAIAVVRDGFFPICEASARPRGDAGLALAEFGLPFASEPEITRHLAEFLAASATRLGEEAQARAGEEGSGRAAEAAPVANGLVVPDAVLFNGGALKPAAVRGRVLDAIAAWCGARPRELAGTDLDLAVARGAAAYGLALRGVGVRIGGGAPRSYHVGLAPAGDGAAGPGGGESARVRVLCVAPRGMEEGESIEIATPEFEVLANAPVRFPIYASTTRAGEAPGTVAEVDPATLVALPEIATVLRFGRSLQARPVSVHLRSHLTETGVLELWCESRTTDHRWRMSFDLRSAGNGAPASPAAGGDLEPEAGSAGTPAAGSAGESVVAPERLAAARGRIEACFAGPPGAADPARLVRELEELLDASKESWPLACVRDLWDALFELEKRRARTPAHEARWLNLAGFLLRPGAGEARDSWRVEQLWRIFERGLAHPGATQARAEWWTLWKRVAGGLTRPQQQALWQEIRPVLVPEAQKRGKPSRWKGGPQEMREMWQVAGSLERVAAGTKLEMLRVLGPRLVTGKGGDSDWWSFGRLAARAPVFGPANTVVDPGAIAPWLEAMAVAAWEKPTVAGLAVAQAARLTGDRVRDLPPALRERLAARLESAPETKRFARLLRERLALDVREQALVLAESLPVGLRLVGEDAGPAAPGA
jgi:hypothetical protein